MTRDDLVVGEKYNWRSQPEQLVYMGTDWQGIWHRFSKEGSPLLIWCEVLSGDLHMMERTK